MGVPSRFVWILILIVNLHDLATQLTLHVKYCGKLHALSLPMVASLALGKIASIVGHITAYGAI